MSAIAAPGLWVPERPRILVPSVRRWWRTRTAQDTLVAAITLVGENDAPSSSATLPSFLTNDVAIVQAYRNGSNTAPSLATGFTQITGTTGANTNSSRVGYRYLQAGDTTTGTWTNATDVQVLVFRGLNLSNPIGNFLGETGSNASPITLSSFGALNVTNGSSWVLGLVAGKGTGMNTITITGAPAMTLLSGAETHMGAWAIEGASSFAGNTTDTQPASSNIYRVVVLELLAGTTAAASLPLQGRSIRNTLLRR